MFLAAALLMPGITAGQPLSGDASRQLHHATGGVVSAAMLMQIITALLVWRAGHGSARYLAVRALLLVLIGVHAHRASGYKNLRTLGIYVRPSTDAVATALADLDPPRRRRRWHRPAQSRVAGGSILTDARYTLKASTSQGGHWESWTEVL